MEEIHIIGVRSAHVFKKDGVTVEVPCTDAEYKALGVKGARRPFVDGYEDWDWEHSYQDHLYDSASGKLENGTYAVETNDRIVMKEVGEKQLVGVTREDVDILLPKMQFAKNIFDAIDSK